MPNPIHLSNNNNNYYYFFVRSDIIIGLVIKNIHILTKFVRLFINVLKLHLKYKFIKILDENN